MLNMYSIYDRKAKFYSAIMLLQNDDVAIRTFKSTVKPGSMLYDFDEDYRLDCLGEFDESTGVMTHVDPRVVCFASDVKEVSNEVQGCCEP